MNSTILKIAKIDVIQSIKIFYNQRVNSDTKLVYGLAAFIALLGVTFILINATTTQYSGFFYLPMRWVVLAPFVLAVTLIGMYARETSPRIAYFTTAYGTYFFILIAFSILVSGIQYTPFTPIDSVLVKWDQSLGFSTSALMQWTAMHPIIKRILEAAYEFLDIEMLLVPLILGLFKNRQTVNRFFVTLLVAFFIGTTIYYFFPTMSPVAMFNNPYFLPGEHTTYQKYFQIHHYLAVTSGAGGMIAFPSFHVAWSIILSYALRNKKWIFIPISLINVIVILSTLFLGWHYLIDVFGGIGVATISILIMHLLYRQYL